MKFRLDIRNVLQGIRHDLDDGEDVAGGLDTIEGMLDDISTLKRLCIDKPDAAAGYVAELCDTYCIAAAPKDGST
jgi:hypothetical protein